jgi:hypothetical protein
MAKAKQAVKARVLVDGKYGQVNEVIELEQDEVNEAVSSGQVDTNEAAVAYALKLLKPAGWVEGYPYQPKKAEA